METLQNIFQAQIIQRLGWTLVHFVWQAATIALILATILKLLHKSSANLRYIIACMALTLIVVMPVVTINIIDVSAETAEPVKPAALDLPKAGADARVAVEIPHAESSPAQVAAAPRVPLKDTFIEAVEPALPHVVVVWLIGVFGLSLWHLGGWTQLQTLRRQMVKQVTPALKTKLQQLSNTLGIQETIGLVESAMVQVPTVVGHLKPVILLPACALTGLSTEQIEALLAHELAHVRRHDYLVNMLQTVVEILGFYHPAVWWVSRKIRVERENCCDDLAVSLCSDRLSYAKALTTMEEIRTGQLALASAASGGNLFDRIRRLLGKDYAAKEKHNWIPSLIAMTLMMMLIISSSLALVSKPEQKQIFSSGINSTIDEIDIDSAAHSDIKDVFGEPLEYIWGNQVFDRDALPGRYVMVYPGDFHVLIVNNRVIEVRFEGPGDYVFGDGLVVGSSVEKALGILGQPSKIVKGKPNEFEDNVLYKNIDGRKGYGYYARPDKNIRIWIFNDKVIAIYLTRSNYSAGGGIELKDAELAETSSINETGHIVDKIDYPFVDDHEVLGGWKSVDFVRDIDVFDPDKKSWTGNLFLKELFFLDGGKTNWAFSWTKGFVLHAGDKTASKYLIKDMDGSKYMFLEWKSGDYTIRHMKPCYYVLKKNDDMVHVESRTIDRTDYPFINDPDVIGAWESVDFVGEIEKFTVGRRQWKGGRLFLNAMIFHNDGRVDSELNKAEGIFTNTEKWTKGLVLDEGEKTASRYITREIDDSIYMFYEWKSGDYTVRYMKPKYYVLKKTKEQRITDEQLWENPEEIRQAAKALFDNIRNADYEHILSYYKNGKWKSDGWKRLLPADKYYMTYTDFPGWVRWICQTFKDNPIVSVELGEVFESDKEISGLYRKSWPAVPYKLVLKDGGTIEGNLLFRYLPERKRSMLRTIEAYWQGMIGLDWHLQDEPIKRPGIQSTESSTAPQILTSAYILTVPADLPQLKEIIPANKSGSGIIMPHQPQPKELNMTDKLKPNMITPQKLEEFLDVVGTTPGARMIAAPKLLTYDGQVGTLSTKDVDDSESITLKVKNSVGPDGKTVRLKLDFEYSTPQSGTSVSTTAAVLSDHAIAVAGGIPLNGQAVLLIVKLQILERHFPETGVIDVSGNDAVVKNKDTVPETESGIPEDYVGHWKGQAAIIVSWTKQKNLPIDIEIHADGDVEGKVGDANLVNGRLVRKNWVYTKVFQHENPYRIEGDLQGEIIESESIQRDSVTISIRVEDGKIDGGLGTSGTKIGGKGTMILSAMDVSLIRIDEP